MSNIKTSHPEVPVTTDAGSRTKVTGTAAPDNKYGLDVTNIGIAKISEDNSTSTPLNNGAVFTGTWTRRTSTEILMSYASDQSFSWVAQFSTDGTNIDSSLPYTYTAGAINVPRRLVIAREYYRIVITNDSGSNMTYLRAQTSEGVFDTLASKLNAALSPDADADVVRAIVAGQQPDGDYVNTPADGIATDVSGASVSTSTPLGSGASYTSGWCDSDGFKSVELSLTADQVSATNGIIIDYTADANAGTPTVVLSKFFTYSAADLINGDLTILFPPRLDGFRVTYTNGADAQSSFTLEATLRTAPMQAVSIPIDNPVVGSTNATVVRAVATGLNTDGDAYENIRQSGVFTNGSTTTPLSAGAEFVGEWLDASHYANLLLFISSDQEFDDTAYTDSFGVTGGILFEIRQNDSGSADYSFIISPSTNPPFHYLKTKPLLKYMRVRYTNGATNQTTFVINVSTEVNASPAPASTIGSILSLATLADTTRSAVFGKTDTNTLEMLPLINVGTEITSANLSLVTKGAIVAEDSVGDYARIERTNNSLNTYLPQVDTSDISIRPCPAYISGQVAADSATPIQVPIPTALEIASVRKLRITNPSASTKLYFSRESDVSTLDGDILLPSQSYVIDLGDSKFDSKSMDPVYLITDGTVATTQTDSLNPDTVDSSSGATNPSNVYTSNDTDCELSASSDTLTVSGFDATGASFLTDIQSVKIKMEAAKAATPVNETSSYNSVVGQDAGNVTSITTPTVANVTDGFYVIAISRRDEFATITEITSTMGFTSFVLVGDTSTDSAESRTSVYYATGTPTGSGTITATFSQGADHCVISATILEGIDTSAPVDSFVAFGANNSSLMYSNSLSASTAGGQFYMAMGFEQQTHSTVTAPSGAAEVFEDGSTAGNDQIQSVIRGNLSAGGVVTVTGTTSGTSDISYVAVAFKPAPAIDPIVRVTNSENATALVTTLSSSTDSTSEVDITLGATWNTALVDAATLTVTVDEIGAASALIDHLYLEVTSSSSVVRIPYSWQGDKP